MKTRLVKGDFEKNPGIQMEKKMQFGASKIHSHDFYELDIILGGENSGSLNEEELKIKRGDVFFLTPEDFHEYSCVGHLDILNLHFTEDFIDKEVLLPLVSGGKRCFSIPEECFLHFERLAAALYELYREEAKNGVIVRLVESLLLLLPSDNDDTVSNKSANIQKAIVYIHAHFKENPALSEVAAIIPFNERYFCKKFKEYTGESYKEYLKKLKLRYARRLLLATDYSIIEVAEMSGYQTQSHFNREYKDYFGETPSETRKEKS